VRAARLQRIRLAAERALVATRRAALEFVEDRGHRSAAQISFFAILSFIPLVLLLAAAFGLVFEDAAVRARIIQTVFDNVPLASADDRPKLERAVADALDRAGDLGIFTTILLLVAASGVTHRLADILDDEDGGGWVLAALLELASELLPLVFVALAMLFLYRVLPMHRKPLREIWPGAIVAALGLALVKQGLELYFEKLADFGALYGSLGAAMALLIFVYAAANVVVFGAEFAVEWARARDSRSNAPP